MPDPTVPTPRRPPLAARAGLELRARPLAVLPPRPRAGCAKYCIYNRRMMPVSLATSTREEGYWALRRTATRLDTGELPTEIAGPDAGAPARPRLHPRRLAARGRPAARYADRLLARRRRPRRRHPHPAWMRGDSGTSRPDGDFVGWLRRARARTRRRGARSRLVGPPDPGSEGARHPRRRLRRRRASRLPLLRRARGDDRRPARVDHPHGLDGRGRIRDLHTTGDRYRGALDPGHTNTRKHETFSTAAQRTMRRRPAGKRSVRGRQPLNRLDLQQHTILDDQVHPLPT